MKCDVCFTNIPLGEDRCPNCGYLIRDRHVNAFDASGTHHHHIQVARTDSQRTFQAKKRTKTYSKDKNTTGILITIISIFFIIMMIFNVFSMIFGGIEYTGEYSTYDSFEEALNEEVDEIFMMLSANNQENLLIFLKDNQYENTAVDERVYVYDDEITSSSYVYAYKNNTYYDMNLYMSSRDDYEDIDSLEINISGDLNRNTDMSKLNIDEKNVEKLCAYFHLENVYENMKDCYQYLEIDEDEPDVKTAYVEYDNYRIHMTQKYYDYGNESSYYYYHYTIEVEQ